MSSQPMMNQLPRSGIASVTCADGDYRVTIACTDQGDCNLSTVNRSTPIHFPDLPTALDFARVEAAGRPAEIELWVGGLYICVHQPRGWPHPICLS